MSVAVRIIPCLDVDNGRVVKGVNFQNLRDAGDPVELAARYDAEGADELTFLDVSASKAGRGTMLDVVRRTAEQVFIPLTVGGGVRSVEDVDQLLRAGADKVSVNTSAIARPELLPGTQRTLRRAVHCTERGRPPRHRTRRRRYAQRLRGDHPRWFPFRRHRCHRVGRTGEELGVGEILLNSMDGDGTKEGFDLELIRKVREAVHLPIIASGGAGTVEHFPPAVAAGADAALAATIFHFGEVAITDCKHAIADAGYEVRL